MTDQKTLDGKNRAHLWTLDRKIWVPGEPNPAIAHISKDEKKLVVAEWWHANGMRIVESFLKEVMQIILPLSNEAVEEMWQKNREQIKGFLAKVPLEDVEIGMQDMQVQGVFGKFMDVNADDLGHMMAKQVQMEMLPGMSDSVSRISQDLQQTFSVPDEDRRFFRAVSVPGGGVRGILTLVVLAAFEKMLGKPISECFDLIACTSIGSVSGAGLTRPDPNNPGKPRYSAKYLLDYMVANAAKIMPPPWFPSMNKAKMLYGPKFSRKGLDEALKELFGDSRLYESTTSLIATAYNIDRSKAELFQFIKGTQPSDKHPDFFIKDPVAASTSAPLHFDPVVIHSIPNRATNNISKAYGCTDGGLFANNPSMVGLIDAFKIIRDNPNYNDILLVSLGTGFETLKYKAEDLKGKGILSWAYALIDMMMKGQSDAVDHQCKQVLGKDRYFHLDYAVDNPLLPEDASPSIAMDDASPENIQKLLKLGEYLVKHFHDDMEKIVDIIHEDDRRREADRAIHAADIRQMPKEEKRHPIAQRLGKKASSLKLVPECVPCGLRPQL